MSGAAGSEVGDLGAAHEGAGRGDFLIVDGLVAVDVHRLNHEVVEVIDTEGRGIERG